MARELIQVESVGPVAVVTLDRPRSLNAMSFQLTGELIEALRELEADDAVQVLVLTGAGDRAFSAGADIKENAALTDEERRARNEARKDWMWYLADYPKPTIGALNGLCFGGGALLASVLDIRIGCERTSFRFLAATYGQLNSTWSLPLVVGWSRAKELLMTGRLVEHEEAARIGLLNHVVPSAELRDRALEMAGQIAANHADAVRMVKRLLHEDVGLGYRQAYDQEVEARASRMRALPVREGFKDFLTRKGLPAHPSG